jgi:hypothetical protein
MRSFFTLITLVAAVVLAQTDNAAEVLEQNQSQPGNFRRLRKVLQVDTQQQRQTTTTTTAGLKETLLASLWDAEEEDFAEFARGPRGLDRKLKSSSSKSSKVKGASKHGGYSKGGSKGKGKGGGSVKKKSSKGGSKAKYMSFSYHYGYL